MSKPKTGNEFYAGRPNRPARPSPYRTPGAGSDRSAPQAQEAQGRRGIATERGPNRGVQRSVAGRPNYMRGEAGAPGNLAGVAEGHRASRSPTDALYEDDADRDPRPR